MLSVELNHLANILDDTKQLQDVSRQARELSERIRDAILETTVRGCTTVSRHLYISTPGRRCIRVRN